MAHRGVPYELRCFHGSEVSVALDQGRLRRPNRGLAGQDGFRFWFEVKSSVWESRSHAARNQRLCFETCAIALTGSTGRPSVLLVVTHPPGT